MTVVEFTSSDACMASHPAAVERATVVVDGYLEGTYNRLRTGPNGREIAALNPHGCWQLPDGRVFSDWAIQTDPSDDYKTRARARRIALGEAAITAGAGSEYEASSPQTRLVDALANVLHAATADSETDFEAALGLARLHTAAETFAPGGPWAEKALLTGTEEEG